MGLPAGLDGVGGGRMLLADRHRWTVRRSWSDGAALLVEVRVTDTGRRSIIGVGDPGAARALLADAAEEIGRVDFLTLPRLGVGPGGVRGEPHGEGPALERERDLAGALRHQLGVEPATAWDRMVLERAPDLGPDEAQRLDLVHELTAVKECLAASNPGSQADPEAQGEAAWFGLRDGDRLIGVIGASWRAGDPDRNDASWHLHGLGVLPEARSRGFGRVLTATAARAGFDVGVDWVSLGMYASNAAARRVYLGLGFEVEGRFTSYRPEAPSAESSAR